MSNVDDIEIFTQNRVIRFFTDTLGYRYLCNWQ
ncbi:Type I restriction-modification system, restriction subunit R [Psychrobacter nivimaris]|uniref:Type I restriction-modification system, restriction subunit R n=1 Tax=Psychrobacter nivimaris TaxID=281738 RepID=A0A6N7BYK3_9GAMM|nr:Type I restriction-modification system, restriction subunit R [Psychrobacter nivimaris]